MLAVIENVHISANRFRGDHERVLGTVPRPVHFAVVVDQVRDLNLTGARAVPADFAGVAGSVLPGVHFGVLQGELFFCLF